MEFQIKEGQGEKNGFLIIYYKEKEKPLLKINC